jgi:hypothetical protein
VLIKEIIKNKAQRKCIEKSAQCIQRKFFQKKEEKRRDKKEGIIVSGTNLALVTRNSSPFDI